MYTKDRTEEHPHTSHAFWWTGNPGKMWSLGDMIQIFIEELVQRVIGLAATSARMDDESEDSILQEPIQKIWNLIGSLVDELDGFAKHYHWKGTLRRIKTLRQRLNSGPVCPRYVVGRELLDVLTALETELSGIYFLQFSSEESTYYEMAPLEYFFANDEEQQERFRSILDDLEQALQCYALRMYTASVFHLMRALEVPLHALWHSVGSTTPAPNNWGGFIKAIKDHADQLTDTKQREFYEEAGICFYNIKQAWRNPTIHDVARLYNREQALRVLVAARGLVFHFTASLDEEGNFV